MTYVSMSALPLPRELENIHKLLSPKKLKRASDKLKLKVIDQKPSSISPNSIQSNPPSLQKDHQNKRVKGKNEPSPVCSLPPPPPPADGHGRGSPARLLRRDVPGSRGRGEGSDEGGPDQGAPERRLRHALPVPRLLRQWLRRVSAPGRHAHHGRRERGPVQHQFAAVVRSHRRGQGRAGEGLPRHRLLRRRRHHGCSGRSRPDRRAGLGSEAGEDGQPDSLPGGLERHNAEPKGQRELPYRSLRRLWPLRQGPGGPLRVSLHRAGPVLLDHVPALQPVRDRQTGPRDRPRFPGRALQALPAGSRSERDGESGLHAPGVRQPVLQGPGRRQRVPEFGPDVVHIPADKGVREEVQPRPGRVLQGFPRGDDQDGGSDVGPAGRDQEEL